MSKTIEELAKQYAKYQTDEQGYGSMEEWKQDVAIYYDDAKEVLSWLFDKPLAQRLTAEEKESIKETYKYHLNAIGDCYTHCMVRDELEHIFGSDFFKEGE